MEAFSSQNQLLTFDLRTSNGIGIMLLCEVAAKPFFEQINANYNAQVECSQAGKLYVLFRNETGVTNVNASATKGLGRTQPAGWQDAGEVLNNDDLRGCWMPKGEFWASTIWITLRRVTGGLTDASGAAYLQYNEVCCLVSLWHPLPH